MAGMTLPQYLLKQAQEHPRDVAIREKQKGIWQEWTWAEYLDEVRALALGLVAIGLEKGDKLAILSDNRPAGLLDHGGRAGGGGHASAAVSGCHQPRAAVRD